MILCSGHASVKVQNPAFMDMSSLHQARVKCAPCQSASLLTSTTAARELLVAGEPVLPSKIVAVSPFCYDQGYEGSVSACLRSSPGSPRHAALLDDG